MAATDASPFTFALPHIGTQCTYDRESHMMQFLHTASNHSTSVCLPWNLPATQDEQCISLHVENHIAGRKTIESMDVSLRLKYHSVDIDVLLFENVPVETTATARITGHNLNTIIHSLNTYVTMIFRAHFTRIVQTARQLEQRTNRERCARKEHVQALQKQVTELRQQVRRLSRSNRRMCNAFCLMAAPHNMAPGMAAFMAALHDNSGPENDDGEENPAMTLINTALEDDSEETEVDDDDAPLPIKQEPTASSSH